MYKFLQGRRGIIVIVLVVLAGFSWTYFGKRIGEYRVLGRTIAAQENEMRALSHSIEQVQTLKSLQVDLRLRVFGKGDALMQPGAAHGELSAGILALARKSGVEFGTMERTPGRMSLRFFGRYPDLARFLTAVETNIQGVEGFTIEKSKSGDVVLSLVVSQKPS